MIPLYPSPYCRETCVHDQEPLQVLGWRMPGMRMLARLVCPRCRREYYADLPAGHGLYYPMLLEIATGEVHDRYGAPWFADWLRESYAQRSSEPLPMEVESFQPVRHPIVVNCLDRLYGYGLLKLLNTQYYLDHRPDLDVVLIVPRWLRWMVPEGVAEIWTVDVPLRDCHFWNDAFADRIAEWARHFPACQLSVMLPHPHPDDYEIKQFTGVAPFPPEQWAERLERPTVTFVWRDDRLWLRTSLGGRMKRFVDRRVRGGDERRHQRKTVVALAESLRVQFPNLDFAVTGLTSPGRLPTWISDLRQARPSESDEHAWCRRYAQSHLVIGVHGSNMLLPSAHAGAVIDLMPPGRWASIGQDMMPATMDALDAMVRCRFLPLESSVETVSHVAAELLRSVPFLRVGFQWPWTDHRAVEHEPICVRREREHVTESVRELEAWRAKIVPAPTRDAG